MAYPTTYEEARAYESEVAQLVAEYRTRRKSEKKLTKESTTLLCEIGMMVPPGRYRHFKGGEYEVVQVLEDVNTGYCYVEYKVLYGVRSQMSALRILVGPDSFLRPIDRKEYRGVRFTRLSENEEVLIDD